MIIRMKFLIFKCMHYCSIFFERLLSITPNIRWHVFVHHLSTNVKKFIRFQGVHYQDYNLYNRRVIFSIRFCPDHFLLFLNDTSVCNTYFYHSYLIVFLLAILSQFRPNSRAIGCKLCKKIDLKVKWQEICWWKNLKIQCSVCHFCGGNLSPQMLQCRVDNP